ncbi:MAG TPA: hypothetical protein VGA98_07495 [Allosphingosinicella sp.]|jgi:hypothetical protein
MTDRPITYSAAMVLALLERRKTQTRRLATSPLRRCEPGDRLWVRENFRHWQGSASRKTAVYAADGLWWDHGSGWQGKPEGISWCSPVTPSIHMPRWASRLTLLVEAVRVEPLQAISAADALAEGINTIQFYPDEGFPLCDGYSHLKNDGKSILQPTPQGAYENLWRLLHTKEGQRWEDNPDVLVLTFRVEAGNIDSLAA